MYVNEPDGIAVADEELELDTVFNFVLVVKDEGELGDELAGNELELSVELAWLEDEVIVDNNELEIEELEIAVDPNIELDELDADDALRALQVPLSWVVALKVSETPPTMTSNFVD